MVKSVEILEERRSSATKSHSVSHRRMRILRLSNRQSPSNALRVPKSRSATSFQRIRNHRNQMPVEEGERMSGRRISEPSTTSSKEKWYLVLVGKPTLVSFRRAARGEISHG